MGKLLVAGLALLFCGCSKTESEEENVRRAFAGYDAAVKAVDLDALKGRVAGEKAAELSKPEARQLLELGSKMRPQDATIAKCTVAGERATLELSGTAEGKPATATASMVRENGAWRLDKEDWVIKMSLAGALPEPETVAPSSESVAAAARPLVDLLASTDADAGVKAWTDLGARYRDAAGFLKELRPALWDERPVKFILIEESFSGGGKSFRYFTPKATAAAGAKAQRAATVGEALRYHLWQYEDVSNSGFKGTFAEWWGKYAVSRKLPAFQ